MKIRKVEVIVLCVDLVLLIVWGASQFHSVIGPRLAIAQFDTESRPSLKFDFPKPIHLGLYPQANPCSRSTKRVSVHLDNLTKTTGAPLAILRIPKIGLKVPVFDGTDDLTLNRGVGRVIGTAQIGGSGNLAIAGHREGFFRALEDVARGDLIELVQSQHTDIYVVRQIRIVALKDISVLSPTTEQTLTLVTGFPFDYIGRAPGRYVVIAHLKPARRPTLAAHHAISFRHAALHVKAKDEIVVSTGD
jgi:sortase A